MRIRIETLITIAIVIALYTGFQGSMYILQNRLQELGILCGLLLFLYASVRASYFVKDLNWNWWFFVPVLFISYTMILPSSAFSVIHGQPVGPSILNARVFLLPLLAPGLYLVYRNGYQLEKIERVFVAVLLALQFSYVFYYTIYDLQALLFSPVPWKAALVVYDDWRGYRLKPLTISLVILTSYCVMILAQAKRPRKQRLFYFLMLCMCIFIWSLVKARTTTLGMIVVMLLYPIFFIRPSRRPLLLGLCITLPFLVFVASDFVVSSFASKEGASLRLNSYGIALDTMFKYPFTGMGNTSAYGITYQDLHGQYFYPSDIGILGVGYKYGFLGVVMYVFFNLYLIVRLVKCNWLYQHVYHRGNPIMFGCMVFLIFQFMNMIINTHLVYGQGLTGAGFVMGYTACWHHRFRTQHAELFESAKRRWYMPQPLAPLQPT